MVIAGGFDPANAENVEHYEELVSYSRTLQIEDHVTFLKSPSDKQKQLLIDRCSAVVYTPENEHFGIVPIEAMYAKRPVITTNTGGPLETVSTNRYFRKPWKAFEMIPGLPQTSSSADSLLPQSSKKLRTRFRSRSSTTRPASSASRPRPLLARRFWTSLRIPSGKWRRWETPGGNA